MVDELQLMTGIDIPCADLKVTLRQPKLKDVALLGETNYFIGLQIVTARVDALPNCDQIKISNWELFHQYLEQEIPEVENVKVLVTNFLQLFFPTKLTITSNSLLLQTNGEFVNIEPHQWELFQSYIGKIGGKDLLSAQKEEEFKPGNKRAAEIAEKMKKARQKLKEATQETSSKTNSSFFAKFIIAGVVAFKISIEDISNMTILQLNKCIELYLQYEAYDLEVKSRLAGAKNDDKLIHWLNKGDSKEQAPSGVGILEG